MSEPVQIINLGAGVQSSTLALMAAKGEVGPMPTAAIFSDTGAEPESVYKWLDWLEKQIPFPVYRVRKGDLSRDELQMKHSKRTFKIYKKSLIPAFTKHNETGKKGMLMRRCTRDYKINPILKKVREIADVGRGCKTLKAIQWIGISTDEIIRMKPSGVPWSKHRWPLIEDLKMSRQDCLKWWEGKGLPKPPRSACVFCPYHNNTEWARLKADEPKEFEKAVAFEKAMQSASEKCEVSDSMPYLHSSLQPLDSINFEALQGDKRSQLNLFNNECEGMCGV